MQRVRRHTLLFALALTLTMLASAFWGCAAKKEAEEVAASASKSTSLDMAAPTPTSETQRAALISLSVAHHKKADIALQGDDSSKAINEMNQLLTACEQTNLNSPETYDVAFDGATRLARLHLDRGEVDEAERAAKRGLNWESKAPSSLFKGYLHQTMGDVLEEKKDLKGAVDSHSAAITIFRELLELKESDANTPPSEVREPK